MSTSSVLTSNNFPSVNSSQDLSFSDSDLKDSVSLEDIKKKNAQILEALNFKVRKLKAKSKELFSSITEEKPEKHEKTHEKFTVQPKDEGGDDLSKLQMFLEKVREINSTREKSKKLINEEQRMIQLASEENKELRDRLEQVALQLCNESVDGEEKCKCLII
jgi:uncharacterized protein YaaN involved in tellurite resistance